jgi:hypothetical protein
VIGTSFVVNLQLSTERVAELSRLSSLPGRWRTASLNAVHSIKVVWMAASLYRACRFCQHWRQRNKF